MKNIEAKFNYNKDLIEKLTILLPLKGRPLLTLRYFLYMEAVKCPFKILIADGSLDEENKKIINNNKHLFPNIHFKYHKFPPDKNIIDFSKKMACASSMINTPYIMWNSNDDLYNLDAIFKCIKFLEEDNDKEYVACGGNTLKYLYFKNKIKFIKKIPHCTKDYNFEQTSSFDRVKDQIPYKGAACAYAIMRTNLFHEAFACSTNLNIDEGESLEYFIVRHLLISGKMKQLNDTLYLWAVKCHPPLIIPQIFERVTTQYNNKWNRFLAGRIATKENIKNVDDILHTMLLNFKKSKLVASLMHNKIGWLLYSIKRRVELCFYTLIPQLILDTFLSIKYRNDKAILQILKISKLLKL